LFVSVSSPYVHEARSQEPKQTCISCDVLPHLPCDPRIMIFYVTLFNRRFKNSVISVCVGYTDSNTVL